MPAEYRQQVRRRKGVGRHYTLFGKRSDEILGNSAGCPGEINEKLAE